MKTRVGFVSNSSSTSFLIAVPKEPSEGMKVYFDLYTTIIEQMCEDTNKDPEYFSGRKIPPSELIQKLEEAIKDHIQDLQLLQDYYNRIADFMGDKKKKAAANQFMEILYNERIFTTDERNEKHILDSMWVLRDLKRRKRPLNEIQRDIQDAIEGRTQRVNELRKQLECIQQYKDAAYLMSFTLDNHWKTNLEKVLENLIEAGVVQCVRRVDS